MRRSDTITLKSYFDEKCSDCKTAENAKFLALENQFNIKVSALEKATTVAAGLMDKRLESMNEFRAQLKDQEGTFVPRSEYEGQQHRIEEDVRLLRETRASAEVSAAMLEKRLESMNEFRAQLKDQAGSFYTRPEQLLFSDSVEKDLRILRESKAMLEGKASQSSVNIALVMGALGTVVSILSFLRGLFPSVHLSP